MAARRRKVVHHEQVQLLRGGELTTNLLGAFGQSVKETRLTALLGYVFAMRPEPLAALFGFTGRLVEVCLETNHDDGRSDILVKTTRGTGIIEAKVHSTDAAQQLSRYPARWHVVLTMYRTTDQGSRLQYVNWQQLADALGRAATSGSATYRFLVGQLNAHLEEHHMIKATESLEVYAREINEPVTLALFIKGHIYGCNYEKRNKVAHVQYFAPNFGFRIARELPGIVPGISFVARVERVFIATKWREFYEGVCEHRGKQWWNSHSKIMKDLHRKWTWTKGEQRSFLLLGEPRLAFNPPIRKGRLQKGTGFLSRRFFSFDDLFAGWVAG